MRIQIIRPYYGINVNGDMGGDLGIADFSSQVTPDLSLVYAYSLLKSFGENVKVCDCNTDKLLASSYISKVFIDQYDEIYVKFAAPTVQLDIAFCCLLKRKAPNVKIKVFGHVAKILKEWIKQNVSEISCVIEHPLDVEFAKKYKAETNFSTLDYLATPCYEDFTYQNYNDTERSIGYLWGSRGCNMTCDYCPYTAYYDKGIIFRSVDLLIQDIKKLIAIGINHIQFRDPFFTCNRQRVIEFCTKILENAIEIQWMCETRIDTLEEELIRLMKKAGCVSIAFGIETSNSEVMKLHARKDYNLERVKETIGYCKSLHIDTLAFYILGFENDTWESISKTYQMACDLDSSYAQFNVFTLYPDTYEQMEDINPMFFAEAKNLTKKKVNKSMSIDQLLMCATHFMDAYNERVFGLEYTINKRMLETMIESRGQRVLKSEKEKMKSLLQQ